MKKLSFALLVLTTGLNPLIGYANNAIVQESFSLPVDTLNGETIFLEGRIDRPFGDGRWPLVIMSSGSGPSNVDLTMDAPGTPRKQCLEWQGEPLPQDKCRWRFYEMTAKDLARQGMAVVRLGKRGVWLDKNKNPLPPNMDQHGTSTLSNRVKDVEKLLTYLRVSHHELNTDSYYLYGFSEGTVISTLYAKKHIPEVKGMILIGAVLDSLENIFRFQTVTVQWRQLLAAADADQNGAITTEEFDLEKLKKPDLFNLGAPVFGDRIKNYEMMDVKIDFAYFDKNADGQIEEAELTHRLEQDIWLPSLAALRANDRDGFKKYDPDAGLNSFDQVKEWFNLGPIGDELLLLDIPVSIFFGNRDLNTPAFQLDRFLPQMKRLGKESLFYAELADDAHNGPNLTAAASRRIRELGWKKNK